MAEPRHNVYVVRLDDAVRGNHRFAARNPDLRPDLPCYYVGCTGLDPEVRFENHKRGHKGSWFVREFGLELVPELYAHLNPMPYEAAIEMEKDLADDLRAAGHGVWQN